jgi:hypothetical protein
MEVSDQLHAPAALPLGKSPRCPLDRRLGAPQSWSGHCGKEDNLDPAGYRTPAVQPVSRRCTEWATEEESCVLNEYGYLVPSHVKGII